MTHALRTTAAAVRAEIRRLEALALLGPCPHPPMVDASDWCDREWLDQWMRHHDMIPAAIEAQQKILERINRSLATQQRKTP